MGDSPSAQRSSTNADMRALAHVLENEYGLLLVKGIHVLKAHKDGGSRQTVVPDARDVRTLCIVVTEGSMVGKTELIKVKPREASKKGFRWSSSPSSSSPSPMGAKPDISQRWSLPSIAGIKLEHRGGNDRLPDTFTLQFSEEAGSSWKGWNKKPQHHFMCTDSPQMLEFLSTLLSNCHEHTGRLPANNLSTAVSAVPWGVPANPPPSREGGGLGAPPARRSLAGITASVAYGAPTGGAASDPASGGGAVAAPSLSPPGPGAPNVGGMGHAAPDMGDAANRRLNYLPADIISDLPAVLAEHQAAERQLRGEGGGAEQAQQRDTHCPTLNEIDGYFHPQPPTALPVHRPASAAPTYPPPP
eukprot:CAMPEP_0118921708 /NCGR_PEP_ID=MMETSP1169-20130426/900_1 /TAXON_ID=36882 /ORGANISM="Pyramimonas obovata, Strain CCMP722" /LENGTH=358 /DNA_ID=CAMNT_0006862479 /DNA_START=320 /DNA_END=1392 /DNA_ORIENTATION=+